MKNPIMNDDEQDIKDDPDDDVRSDWDSIGDDPDDECGVIEEE